MRASRVLPGAAVATALAAALACSGDIVQPHVGAPLFATATGVTIAAIIPTPDSILVGQLDTLSQKLTDGTTTWYGQNCTWTVSDASIASITNIGGTYKGSQGVLKGLKAGTVTVTVATQFGTSKSISVRVVGPSGDGGGGDGGTPGIPGGTTISPGTSIQAQVDANPAGTTFHLKAGTHRLQTITPKSGDIFIGDPGAIISGARVLSTFTRQGSYWVASGQTQQGIVSQGMCNPLSPRCNYPEDLFLNDRLLVQVSQLSAVAPGKWYFDYAADKIYFADDPTGKRVETSVLPWAFGGTASDVTIQGLIIEKFAAPGGYAAIYGDKTSGWLVQTNELRWNHAAGLALGTGMRALNNKIHHNGEYGVQGQYVSDVLLEGNEIYSNNTSLYHVSWGGGASKFWSTTRLTVRNNYVHNNIGKGLWTDTDNIYTVYENNRVTDNLHQGIFHEVSYDCVIRNNIVERNGFGNASKYFSGAGILVASSSNVEIYGNTVNANAHGITAREEGRGSGKFGPWLVQNLYVHDNTVTMTAGQTGLQQWIGDNTFYTSKNNRFVHNSYKLNGLSTPFYWMNTPIGAAQWKAYGQDVTGTFTP